MFWKKRSQKNDSLSTYAGRQMSFSELNNYYLFKTASLQNGTKEFFIMIYEQ